MEASEKDWKREWLSQSGDPALLNAFALMREDLEEGVWFSSSLPTLTLDSLEIRYAQANTPCNGIRLATRERMSCSWIADASRGFPLSRR
jgi:hypothetical protein